MKIVDAGHKYSLEGYLGGEPQILQFMKKEGDGFPFNLNTNGGTNCQEVLRAVIDRSRYLNNQIPCAETEAIIGCLESALVLFELRAASRHGRTLVRQSVQNFMCEQPCKKCGHIGCEGHAE